MIVTRNIAKDDIMQSHKSVYLYVLNIKNIVSVNEVRYFIHIISEDRRERINRLLFVKNKIQSLFAEIILRYALWEQYKLSDLELKFEQLEYGKPSLANYKEIHFNLSHSRDWVLCGVGDIPIGIDVKKIKYRKILLNNRVYTKEETDFIFTYPIEDRPNIFYKIWALKERYVKNIGKELSISLDSFLFQFHEDKIKFYLDGIQNINFSFLTGQLDERYVTALCVDSRWKNRVDEKIKILSLKQLREWRRLQSNYD